MSHEALGSFENTAAVTSMTVENSDVDRLTVWNALMSVS